jgi:putative acetyltransferase
MNVEPNSPMIQIRIAAPGDAASIASVLYQSFVEYQSLYTPEGFAATVLSRGQMEERLRLNEGPLWVACLESAIVGSVSAIVKGESVYLRSMALLPIARGQGIGILLLRRVEDFAIASGSKRLFLSTTPFLTRAIRLYERFGFRRNNELSDDLFGTPLFTMVKPLEFQTWKARRDFRR